MLAYSARKNMAKAMPEYSIMWPATISDSPSTTSNGWRLVSARPEMKYTTKIGEQRQPVPGQEVQAHASADALLWLITMSVMFRLAGHHQHHHQAEAHRDFVADHLRRGAQRAQEGVLRVRGPARDDDAVDLQRGDGHQEQQAGVDVGQRDARAEGHHRPGGQRRHDGHDGAEHEQALVRRRRDDDFLDEQLERVGDRVQQAQRPDAVRGRGGSG